MSNLVLYRKHRPQTFSEIIGQEYVVKTLTNAIVSDMISHAYIFSGPHGTGKTTIARLLAKAVNCENRKGFEPCNKCSSCVDINLGRSLDLIEIDAASHRGIDQMRELRDTIQFVPSKSKYKVFIIDESHHLTKEASNALLKTLEEPPKHAIFVLATTEIYKMLPTIISRCQRFDFKRLTLDQITKRLNIIAKKEKIKIEKSALELIAVNSKGSSRDAESILGQAIVFCTDHKDKEITSEEVKNLLGLVKTDLVLALVDFLIKKDVKGAIDYLNKIYEEGGDLQEFSKALVNYLRQILIFKIAGGSGDKQNPIITGLTKDEFKKLQSQAEGFKQEELSRILNLFLVAENKMRYSSITRLPLELAIIEATQKDK